MQEIAAEEDDELEKAEEAAKEAKNAVNTDKTVKMYVQPYVAKTKLKKLSVHHLIKPSYRV